MWGRWATKQADLAASGFYPEPPPGGCRFAPTGKDWRTARGTKGVLPKRQFESLRLGFSRENCRPAGALMSASRTCCTQLSPMAWILSPCITIFCRPTSFGCVCHRHRVEWTEHRRCGYQSPNSSSMASISERACWLRVRCAQAMPRCNIALASSLRSERASVCAAMKYPLV